MTIGVVLVGLAPWGRSWGAIVNSSSTAVVVACVDTNPATHAAAQAELDLSAEHCFSSLELAFAAFDAEAVIIAAAPYVHTALALQAIAAGKHVLVEKPFALTLPDARLVADAARAAGRIVMVSQNYRFFPAPQAAASIVRQGSLGLVKHISIDFRQNAQAVLPPNHPLFSMPQPLLTEMAVHHWDLLRMVLDDEPETVHCRAWCSSTSTFNGPSTAEAVVHFSRGAIAMYRGSWDSTLPPTLWAGEWLIECSNGTLRFTSRNGQNLDGDRRFIQRDAEPLQQVPLPAMQPYDRAAVLESFLHAIHTASVPLCSALDNLGTIALMQSAIRSVESGKRVRVIED